MMGGLLAVGLAVPAVQRLRRAKHPSEATKRELQLQLLGRLELSGHGAIGGLSAVRRLVWNLDALAQGFTLGEERLGVMRDMLAEIRKNQVPKLFAAVELARLSGLDPGRADLASSQLGELKNRLDEAAKGMGSGSTPRSLAQGLKDAAAAAETIAPCASPTPGVASCRTTGSGFSRRGSRRAPAAGWGCRAAGNSCGSSAAV